MPFEALLFLKVNRSLWDARTVGKAMGRTRECEEAVDYYIDIDDNDSGGSASGITRSTFSEEVVGANEDLDDEEYYYDEME